MTTLDQKLQQLNLKAISRQLETTIAEAAARNLSVAATLERLADMDWGRAIERRFKCSRLQSQPGIDAFTSITTKAACRRRTAFCACWIHLPAARHQRRTHR
jgi:hypothetical protein